MRFKNLLTTTAAVMVLWAAAAAGQSAHVGYDTFMQGDLDARIEAFQSITPENRAEIVRTQIERWLARNRSRLSPPQIALLEEARAFATADAYTLPPDPDRRARTKDLETRAVALFTPEDLGEALTISGAYIPQP